MLTNNVDKIYLENNLPFWNSLTDNDKKLLIDNSANISYKKGHIIYSNHDDCKGLALIRSGNLRTYMLSDVGKEITIYRLFERDACIMTAACLLKNITFNVIVEVERDCEITLIPVKTYDMLNKSNIAVQNFTNQLVSSRFSDVMWVFEQIVFMSLDKRLALFLLEQSAIEDSDTLLLTHDMIAKNLGSAREVVTRMLKYFQSSDLVTISRGNVVIKDRKKLIEFTK